jgi:hypothetical protein
MKFLYFVIIEKSWKGTSSYGEGTGFLVDPWTRLSQNMEGCRRALTCWQRTEVGKTN